MDPPILSGANLQVKSGFQGLLWLCRSPNPRKVRVSSPWTAKCGLALCARFL
jgi:hypothetical protein